MKELINNRMSLTSIKRVLTITSINEINNISQPCYSPQLKKHYFELLRYANITDKQVSIAVKNYWKNTKAKTWNLENDNCTNLLILFMHLFLQKRDIQAFKSAMLYHMVRQYSNVFHHYLPQYCNENVFRYTLDNLTKTHIFYIKETIGSAVFYLSESVVKRYQKILTEYKDPMQVSLFIRESRHRLAQSFRSFANSYYKNDEAGKGIKQTDEYEDVEDKLRSSKLIDDLVNKITVYRIFDRKAFDVSRKFNKTDVTISKKLISALMDPKYKDDLKLCYELFIKNLPDEVSAICSTKFFKILKKLLSLKTSKTDIYFKKQCQILLNKLFNKIKMEKDYSKYSEQTKFNYLNFLTMYFMLILRFNICQN